MTVVQKINKLAFSSSRSVLSCLYSEYCMSDISNLKVRYIIAVYLLSFNYIFLKCKNNFCGKSGPNTFINRNISFYSDVYKGHYMYFYRHGNGTKFQSPYFITSTLNIKFILSHTISIRVLYFKRTDNTQ